MDKNVQKYYDWFKQNYIPVKRSTNGVMVLFEIDYHRCCENEEDRQAARGAVAIIRDREDTVVLEWKGGIGVKTRGIVVFEGVKTSNGVWEKMVFARVCDFQEIKEYPEYFEKKKNKLMDNMLKLKRFND